MDSVLTCMVNDTLGPGERSAELVSMISQYLGRGGGVTLRERPRALALALEMLELAPGSRIAMDPLVPHYYHRVVVSAGLTPVYFDVAAETPCIDADAIEDAMTGESPPAAAVVHTAQGYVPDLERIVRLGIPIVEDITEGVGASTGDRLAGSYGRYVIVGMEPDGIVTAGGGTVLLAETKADAARLRAAACDMPVEALLPDMNAALGITQMKQIERFVERRSELAGLFSRAIMRGRHSVPAQPGDGQNVHFAFPVLLTCSVSEVRQYARKKGVESALAFEESVLAHGTGEVAGGPVDGNFPSAGALVLRCLRFPLYPALTGTEATMIERVLSTLP